MAPLTLLTLLASHLLAGAIAWLLCRRRASARLAAATRRCSELETDARHTLERLRGVRDQLHAAEHLLIHCQLVREQQEQAAADQAGGERAPLDPPR